MLHAAGRATTFPTTTTQGDSVGSLSPSSCWTPPSVHTQLACEGSPASLTMHTCDRGDSGKPADKPSHDKTAHFQR